MDRSKHSSFSSSASTPSYSSPQTDERVVDTTTLTPVSVYVEDQRNLEPGKMMPYMFMLGRGSSPKRD